MLAVSVRKTVEMNHTDPGFLVGPRALLSSRARAEDSWDSVSDRREPTRNTPEGVSKRIKQQEAQLRLQLRMEDGSNALKRFLISYRTISALRCRLLR